MIEKVKHGKTPERRVEIKLSLPVSIQGIILDAL